MVSVFEKFTLWCLIQSVFQETLVYIILLTDEVKKLSLENKIEPFIIVWKEYLTGNLVLYQTCEFCAFGE